jgi:hypothetical protein
MEVETNRTLQEFYPLGFHSHVVQRKSTTVLKVAEQAKKKTDLKQAASRALLPF